MLKKRINDQMQFEDKFDAQLEKYEIMKNKTNAALIVRQNLLSKMISFENMSILKNETEVFEMQKLYSELEDHVKIIKSETIDMDYKLNLIVEEIRSKQKIMADYKGKARYLLPERNNFRREYILNTLKFNKIFRVLNVDSIEQLIEIFNKEKFSYQSNYMQFNNLNKEIIDLNVILTAYDKDLKKIEVNLKTKEFKEMLSGDYKSDVEVSNFEILYKDCKSYVEEQMEKISKIGKVIKRIKRDFLRYDKNLNFIRKCISDMNLNKLKDKDFTNSKIVSTRDNSSSILPIKEKGKLENIYSQGYFNEINSLPIDTEWSKGDGKDFYLFIF